MKLTVQSSICSLLLLFLCVCCPVLSTHVCARGGSQVPSSTVLHLTPESLRQTQSALCSLYQLTLRLRLQGAYLPHLTLVWFWGSELRVSCVRDKSLTIEPAPMW